MQTLRLFTAAPIALALVSSAHAQFDGPAPLAWRWSQNTSVAPNGAPLVIGDTIYTAIGGRVYAIDRPTGNKKWQYPTVDPIPGQFRTTPILVDGMLIAAGDNKVIYAVDPLTGAAKWNYVSPSPVFGALVAVGKFVAYATSDNKLIALEGATGTVALPAYNIYDRIQGQIAGYNNGIVFFNGKNELRNLDIVSKKANYARPIRFGQLPAGATPVLLGDTFYVSSGPYVVAVNASSGTAKWQTDTRLQLEFTPAPSANGVLVVSRNGEALVLDPLSGRPVSAMRTGPVKLGSFVAVRPSVAGTKFVVPTTNGAINLLDPTTGDLLWSYVIRPVGDLFETSSTPQGGAGGRGGGFGGQGGRGPGGGRGAGGGADQGRRITTLAASGPAVLAGSTLIVPAQDGSILAFDKDLGVDVTPPKTTQVWPTQGDVVSGLPPLQLIFRLDDEAAGVQESTIKVEIDGKEAGFTYSRDGYIQVAFSNLSNAAAPNRPLNGAAKPPIVNPTLQNGRHAVKVTVSDWLGNETTSDYSIVIDNSLAPLPLPGGEQTGQSNRPGGGGRGGFGDGGR